MRRSVTVSPPFLPPPQIKGIIIIIIKTYYVVAFKIERELPSLVYLLRDVCVILMSVWAKNYKEPSPPGDVPTKQGNRCKILPVTAALANTHRVFQGTWGIGIPALESRGSCIWEAWFVKTQLKVGKSQENTRDVWFRNKQLRTPHSWAKWKLKNRTLVSTALAPPTRNPASPSLTSQAALPLKESGAGGPCY